MEFDLGMFRNGSRAIDILEPLLLNNFIKFCEISSKFLFGYVKDAK
jgi:hypothetical protein